ncbi:hypothetical protein [Frondihabitans sucicola]
MGAAAGRESDAAVTLFNSVGVGLQDLAAAASLLARADLAEVGELADARG